MSGLKRLAFHIREALEGIRHAGWMNLATVTTVALSLFILGIFLLTIRNLNMMLDRLRSQYQLVLFLKKDLEPGLVAVLVEKLQDDPDVLEARLVDKEAALRELEKELAASHTALPKLEGNPLPDAVEVTLREGTDFDAFMRRCASMAGVETLSSGQQWVGRLLEIVDLVRVSGLVMILILGTSTLLIIANTIKLTVYARRNEINIMQLVGATNWFIRIPFLIEGLLQGLAGAILAVVMLMLFYGFLVERIHEMAPYIPIVDATYELTKLSFQLILMGLVLGLLGSLLSLRRILV